MRKTNLVLLSCAISAGLYWQTTAPVKADNGTSSRSISWFLEDQYKKSKTPQIDSLLAPLPAKSQDNEIEITPPGRNDLVVIGSHKLDPIKLEATISKNTTLADLLELALENNLAIKISQETVNAGRYTFISGLGKFLPDLSMTYKKQSIYQDGNLQSRIGTRNLTLTYAFFQGGRVYFDSRSKYFDYKAAKYALRADKNDILLDVFKKYNNVLYNQMLLHIRVKSLESSRAALAVNSTLFQSGSGTKYAVMQSKTQVASDAQKLVSQEVELRRANIELAALLNQSLFENLVPEQKTVSKKFLLDPGTNVSQALTIALANRPELKQYESQLKAAKANIGKTAAALWPTGQIYLSPNNTSFNTGNTNTASSNNGSAASSSSINLSTSGTGATSVGLGNALGSSVSYGATVSWNLSGLGMPDAAATLASRSLARRAQQQYNQEVLTIIKELRKSYIDVQTAEQQIEITNEGVEAARESLRLAYIRLKVGTGTNLEYIQSQQSYVDALANQAKAYIEFQNTQAQLLRDLGVISVAALVDGYAAGKSQS